MNNIILVEVLGVQFRNTSSVHFIVFTPHVKDVFYINGKQAISWMILHHEINFASYPSNERKGTCSLQKMKH